MPHTASGQRPKESTFYEPMVYLLGKLTGFKPYVGVSHELVRDDVLRLAGFNLLCADGTPYGGGKQTPARAEDLKGNSWALRSTSSQRRDGLYRVVHFAWYHQTRTYHPTRDAVCGKPIYGTLDQLEDDKWALLDIEDDEAEILRNPKAPPKAKQRVRKKMADNAKLLDEEDAFYLKILDEEIRELKAKARGEWALTELGVKEAKALKEKYEGKIVLSAGPNVTARYLGKHWPSLYGHITVNNRMKMPRSEQLGKCEDHAMAWIERIIQRDGLRSRIEEGKSIAPSKVRAWALRGAYTDIRNEGREPVCRVFHGALTKKEIEQYDPSNWTEVVIPRTINESEQLAVNSYAEHSEDDFVGDPIDNLRDDHPSADVEGVLLNEDAFQVVLDRVSEIIHDEIDPDLNPEFHEQLMVERYVKEMTVREIAEAHGLSDEDEVSTSLDRVRLVMLRARAEGDFDDVIVR